MVDTPSISDPKSRPGFLDAASGSWLNPGGREALLAAFERGWADPTRRYREGRMSGMLLDAARATIAGAMDLRPPEVSFTGSATDAMHRAIAGRLAARPGTLVTSGVEHSAILRAGDRHEAAGGAVVSIGVDAQGRVHLAQFTDAISDESVSLACLQAFNHEVGTAQPVPELFDACRATGVPLLVDVSMSLGRVSAPPLGDLIVGSAISWGGPAGVGVIGVRSGVAWTPPGPYDEREAGRVPGLPAVAAIVVAARALEWALAQQPDDASRCRSLLNDLRVKIPRAIPGVRDLGDPTDALPHLLALSCLYTSADALVDGLDEAGFAVSSGSSCVADTRRPSHVLEAMGALTQGNLRLTLPLGSDDTTTAGFTEALAKVIAADREALGAPEID